MIMSWSAHLMMQSIKEFSCEESIRQSNRGSINSERNFIIARLSHRSGLVKRKDKSTDAIYGKVPKELLQNAEGIKAGI